VLAQRLVRVICQQCKQPNGTVLSPKAKTCPDLARASCPECDGRGYIGMGIFEMMDVNDEVQLIMNADSVLTRTARKNGMRNLREDGWRKIEDGVTTVEEVMRVTQEF
jgi:type II secretory ATPase GspE/PulE/Tfp pilus assembly ATPase PilB-like protein